MNFLPLKKAPRRRTSTPVTRRCNWKTFDFVREGALLYASSIRNDIVAVFFFTDKEAALDVALGFAAGFDDVAVGIFHDEFDRGIEGVGSPDRG